MPLNPVTPINPNQNDKDQNSSSPKDFSNLKDLFKKKKSPDEGSSSADLSTASDVDDPYTVKHLDEFHDYA